jgi:hypothetical protein
MFGDFQLNTRISNPDCAASSVLGRSARQRLESQKAFSLICYFIALFRKPALPKAQFLRRAGKLLNLGTLKSPGVPIRADFAQIRGQDAVAGSLLENAQTP